MLLFVPVVSLSVRNPDSCVVPQFRPRCGGGRENIHFSSYCYYGVRVSSFKADVVIGSKGQHQYLRLRVHVKHLLVSRVIEWKSEKFLSIAYRVVTDAWLRFLSLFVFWNPKPALWRSLCFTFNSLVSCTDDSVLYKLYLQNVSPLRVSQFLMDLLCFNEICVTGVHIQFVEACIIPDCSPWFVSQQGHGLWQHTLFFEPTLDFLPLSFWSAALMNTFQLIISHLIRVAVWSLFECQSC